MTDKSADLRSLLADIRKARAHAVADIGTVVSSVRLDRWAKVIEAFLENAGQGSGHEIIALENLSSEND